MVVWKLLDGRSSYLSYFPFPKSHTTQYYVFYNWCEGLLDGTPPSHSVAVEKKKLKGIL